MSKQSDQHDREVGVIIDWLTRVRFATYRIEQGSKYKSGRRDPGVSDVLSMHPAIGLLWIEVKTGTGTLNPDQRAFLNNVRECGGHHIVGDLTTVQDALVQLGALVRNNGQLSLKPHWGGKRWPPGYPLG